MGNMSTYAKYFNSDLSEQEVSFDTLVIDVSEENKHLVLPLLVQLTHTAEQKALLTEICERMKFDIAALEAGVSPQPISNAAS